MVSPNLTEITRITPTTSKGSERISWVAGTLGHYFSSFPLTTSILKPEQNYKQALIWPVTHPRQKPYHGILARSHTIQSYNSFYVIWARSSNSIIVCCQYWKLATSHKMCGQLTSFGYVSQNGNASTLPLSFQLRFLTLKTGLIFYIYALQLVISWI